MFTIRYRMVKACRFQYAGVWLGMGKTSRRLGREDWIKAGFRALVANGDAALKVEPLARLLGATKGSFYWHFKDLAEYETALLLYWEEKALSAPIEAVADLSDPFERLLSLAEIAGRGAGDEHGGMAAEPALRAYARSRENAQSVVDRVDQARLAWLQENLNAAGADDPEGAAYTVYATVIGLDFLKLSETDITTTLKRLIQKLTKG